jgi:glyoxylase-like metal-dependent hydrolase (beta-lactamase superfamily II)
MDEGGCSTYHPNAPQRSGGATMPRIKVGSLEVVSVLDLSAPFAPEMVCPDVAPSGWEPYRGLYPAGFSGGQLAMSISSFVILGGGQTVLVDTGLGPKTNPEAPGKLVPNLEKEGIGVEDVDTVVFTHLHLDHVGWNFVDGKPTFPRASYVVQQADWNHFSVQTEDPIVQAQVVPLQTTAGLKLVDGETQLTSQITLVPTPGHTPGHQSVIVASGRERAFIAGDLGHHPAQVQETAWRVGFDNDAAMASETRERVMAQLEQDGDSACFGHFPAPGFGIIVREDGRRLFRAL